MPDRHRPAQDIRYFRIGTGETGGSLFILGGVIASAVSNPPGSRSCDDGGSCGVPGLIALAQTTAGSVENVADIGSGQLDSGLCQADVAYWAYNGKDIFEHDGAIAKLRALANLYEESVHVVVHRDSKIKSIGDLKGARVNLGPKNSGNLLTARLVLKAFGLNEKKLQADYADLATAAAKFTDGSLDALIVLGEVPMPAIVDLAAKTPLTLLPVGGDKVAQLRLDNGFLSVDIIPADGLCRRDGHLDRGDRHSLAGLRRSRRAARLRSDQGLVEQGKSQAARRNRGSRAPGQTGGRPSGRTAADPSRGPALLQRA